MLFDSQVEKKKMFLGFSMKFSIVARSLDLCPFNGNRLAPYYMGPKTYRRTVGVHWYTSGQLFGEYRRDGMLIYRCKYNEFCLSTFFTQHSTCILI